VADRTAAWFGAPIVGNPYRRRVKIAVVAVAVPTVAAIVDFVPVELHRKAKLLRPGHREKARPPQT